ncbi:MAG: hypothetical protein WCG14_07795 [Chlamydiia bacterium]
MERKEKKFHYLYKITNTKNGKYYIGMHSTHNLDDEYMGGGKRITNSVRKHGKEAHTKEILEYFDDRESLRQKEIEIVNEDLLRDPMCMNINKGGEGGWLIEWQKLGAANANKKNWQDPEFVKKIKESSSKTLKKLWSDPQYRESMLIHSAKAFSGKQHTDEYKDMMSRIMTEKQSGEFNSQFGKIWIYNITEKKSIRIQKDEIQKYTDEGWTKGRKMKF